MSLIRQQLKDAQLIRVNYLLPISASKHLWSAQDLQTATAMESLQPKLKTLYQSLATSLCSGSSISTAESLAPCSVSINSVSINSIDMRFCCSMLLLLLLQHQQTGCPGACSEWPIMLIRHCKQPRPPSQQPSPCCCQHMMACSTQCDWFSCAKTQSTLVHVSAHCVSPHHFSLHLIFTLAQMFCRPWRSAWAD